MHKFINKLLNISIIGLVIFTLISYQFILPISFSRADDGSATEEEQITEEPQDTDNSGSDESSDNNGDEGVNGSNGTNGSEEENMDNGTNGSNGDEGENGTAALGIGTTNPALTTNENTLQCLCQDDDNYDYQKEDCDKDYPDDCHCFIDYCKTINIDSTNVAEEVDNSVQADSTTGGNEIVNEKDQNEECTEGDGDKGCDGSDGVKEENDNNGSNGNEEINGGNGINGENESNAVKGVNGDAIIDTGDAAAQAVSVNEINTNIYTENGVEVTQNIDGDYTGDIDLLETFNNILEGAKNLSEQNQKDLEHVTVTNTNVAEDVDNTVTANADSGNNTIENENGSATIITGTAQAVASAVNIINTNIVGNNWLFAVINIFGNWTGDLIVPGVGLLNTPTANMIFDKVVDINEASDIENSVDSSANTGNNSASGSGDSAIQTGDAYSSASSTNIVNTNITTNNWFFLLINNSGSWVGRVINWNSADGSQSTVYEYDFGALDDGYQPQTVASVYNYNNAVSVKNSVVASADTGGNQISSSGDAYITTGNAGAWASAFNLINTNITGNNWLFGIVNNAGNWNGNVVFAYPDLSVSLNSDKKELGPGEALNYTITYKNNGKAACQDAKVALDLPQYLEYNSNDSGSPQKNGNSFSWMMSGLKPGEERSFNVGVILDKDVPSDIAMLTSAVSIETDTAETELSNNSNSSAVDIVFPDDGSDSPSSIDENSEIYKNAAKNSDIGIERKDDLVVPVGTITTHEITVRNTGKETLYNILATEKVKDPNGQKLGEYSWAVAKLKKGQRAIITYQVLVGPLVPLGTYTYSAQAVGYNQYGYEVESGKAESQIQIVAGTSVGYISGTGEDLIPPAEASSEDLPQTVLGVEIAKNKFPWNWLWLLLLAPIAYWIKRKELYRWHTLQRLARNAAGFLSSFLS